ncbi:MAG: hypothetical protein QXU98_09295 [Candidatus Parvarchaeota archaeon]
MEIKSLPYLVLIILLAVVFISEIYGYNGTPYYEFDPFMYAILVKVLAIHGSIPISGLAYPCGSICSSNRFEPIQPYLMAGYYDIFGNLYSLMTIVPPILFIIMALFVFVGFRHKYGNEWFAMIVAGLVLTMPTIWQQFGYGMFQEEAWGFALVIALFMSYYMAIDTNKLNYTILSGIIFMAVLLSSKYFTIAVSVIPLFIFLEIMFLWKDKDKFSKFLKTNLVIFAFVFLANIMLLDYHGGFALSGFSIGNIFVPINLLLFGGALGIGILLYILVSFAEKHNKKVIYAVIGTILIMAVIITPFYKHLGGYVEYLISYLHGGAYIPLFNTVQEFAPTPATDLSVYFGAFGSPYVYWAILVSFVLVAILTCIKYSSAEKKLRLANNAFVLLWACAILPIFFIAVFGVSKYISDGGLMLVIAFGIIFGEIYAKYK